MKSMASRSRECECEFDVGLTDEDIEEQLHFGRKILVKLAPPPVIRFDDGTVSFISADGWFGVSTGKESN